MTLNKMAATKPRSGTTEAFCVRLCSRSEALETACALLPRLEQRMTRTESDRRLSGSIGWLDGVLVEHRWLLYTASMRWTASKTIRMADSYIPWHRAAPFKHPRSGKAPRTLVQRGAIYLAPFQEIAPFSLIDVPVCLVRGALNALITGSMTPRLSSFAPRQLAAQGPTLSRLGAEAADIDSAYALALEEACQL